MPDRFAEHARGLTAPAENAFAVTPNDGSDLAEVTRALYVGTGGNLAVVLAAGSDVTLLNVQSGTVLPIRCRRVKVTGTTASGLVGLF